MQPLPTSANIIPPATGWLEAANMAFIKGFLRLAFKPFMRPGVPFGIQRMVVRALSKTMLPVAAVVKQQAKQGTVPAMEVISPKRTQAQGKAGAILYLHGGALCLGSPATHRSLTTRLAQTSGMTVYVVDYRKVPEHPYPAAPDDVQAAYHHVLGQGFSPSQVVVAGDSAGGLLCLSLAIRLKLAGATMPAGLLLLSPVTDPLSQGETHRTMANADPMIRPSWLKLGQSGYQCPPGTPENNPLMQDLTGLPPMLIQVGSQEVLLSDSTALAAHARASGVSCDIEIQTGGWHDYQLQGFFLKCARTAVERLGQQACRWVQTA
jgi:acetyl esterase/lipase